MWKTNTLSLRLDLLHCYVSHFFLEAFILDLKWVLQRCLVADRSAADAVAEGCLHGVPARVVASHL